MNLQIQTGTSVTLHFSLALENGHIVDSNFEGNPATFSVGDGNLLPGFESSLLGLEVGDEREFIIPPENAFGQHNTQNVQSVDRGNFDESDLEIGSILSFQNGDGELPGVIIALEENLVMVDFNHPLSGKNIVFQVKIVEINPERVH
ncbi:MAG: peptidylprolyl isomerase [Porticoccaceae bacterium]|jgi:FKBP-type peptidyl-prolyl cis-trans isomerase SlpA|tara:strand:+ start:641 stop:1081 length:441 start_codon:yes stop_codon:yes gene_type:complete